MIIEVIRAFSIGGERQEPGSVIDVPDVLGLELIGAHKALAVPDPLPDPAPEEPARRPRKSRDAAA